MYACANTNNKDNKEVNFNKGLFKENHYNIIYSQNNNNPTQYYWQYEEDFYDLLNGYNYLFSSLSRDQCSILDDDLDQYNGNSYQYAILGNGEYRLCAGSDNYYDSDNDTDVEYNYFILGNLGNNSVYEDTKIFFNKTFVSYSPYLTISVIPNSEAYNNIVRRLSSYNFIYNIDYHSDVNDVDVMYVSNSFYAPYFYGLESDDVFGGVTNGMTDFIDTVGKGLESSFEIFYDEDNSQLTAIGWLSVIVVAVGLSWTLFSIVSGLIRLRG